MEMLVKSTLAKNMEKLVCHLKDRLSCYEEKSLLFNDHFLLLLLTTLPDCNVFHLLHNCYEKQIV